MLEQSGKLLGKRMAAYSASYRQADRLNCSGLFCHGVKYCPLACDSVERWLRHRDNRHDTAHNYGEDLAETTLKLLRTFVKHTKAFWHTIKQVDDG